MNQVCKICGKSCSTKLILHVKRIHHINTKDYYDKYFKQPNDGICLVCGKETLFYRTSYNKCCCQSCSAKYRQSLYNHDKDVKKFEEENNCTNIVKLRQIYGQGWYKAKIVDYIEKSFQTQMFFVKNEDISKIEEYTKVHKYNGKSHLEKQIVKALKSHNIRLKENDKLHIYPKELDIYLPDYNTAIEFNGTWFHSMEAGCDKNYHLNKSILCRNKGIRLMHIYEFEDLNEQINLLLEYINGNDLYKDFNKNNFLDIPDADLIYVSERGYHVYGAGKLERNYL